MPNSTSGSPQPRTFTFEEYCAYEDGLSLLPSAVCLLPPASCLLQELSFETLLFERCPQLGDFGAVAAFFAHFAEL